MNRQRDNTPERLLEQMGRSVVPVLPPEREAQLQARTAATVDRALDRMSEKRSLWRGRVSGALVAAAAISVMVLSGGWLLHARSSAEAVTLDVVGASAGAFVIRGSGARISAVQGVTLEPGDELDTAAGAHAKLSLVDQAAVEVASETRVRIAEPPPGNAKNERLELVQGEVSFRVPKLEPGSTLSVRTPDALVTVRGTRFTVNVERGDSTVVTRVSVLDGRVEVESHGRTLFLTRGERWSSAVDDQAERPAPVAAGAPESITTGEAPSRAAPPVPQEAKATEPTPANSRPAATAQTGAQDRRRSIEPPSTLADENAMYQSALRSAQSGDTSRSLATLEGLMQKYPRSPLVQSARVEHFRVLLQMGNLKAAGREARRYLSEYPSGFARAEARQIALRGLGDAD